MDIFCSCFSFLFSFVILTFCKLTNGKVKSYIKNYNGNYAKIQKCRRGLKLFKENETEVKLAMYPNPVLRKKCEDVLHFDDNLKSTIRRMFDTLYAKKVKALCAPQVYINKKIIIWNGRYEKRKEENEKIFINPTIIEQSLIKKKFVESCLSSPKIEGKVGRPVIVSISYFDICGNKHLKVLKGLYARLFQHEYDHLNGVLFFDRMTQNERKKVKAQLNQLRREYKTDQIPAMNNIAKGD